MPPITWRNVDAPTATGASRILENAGKSMNKGLGVLGGMVSEYENMQSANIANQNKINTDSVLSQIAGLGDLDSVKAAQKDGLFAAENLPVGVDQKAIDSALTARPDVLANQFAKENANAKAALSREEAPLRAELNNLIGSGNLKEAEKLLAQGGIQDTSGFSQAIAGARRGARNEFRREEEYQMAKDAAANAPYNKISALQTEADIAKTNINAQSQLAELPVDKAVTLKQQSVSQGDALGGLKAAFPNKTWYDSSTDSGGTEGVDRVRDFVSAIEADTKQVVPGYIIEEVTKQIQAESGGEDNATFSFDKSFNPERFEELLKARLGQASQSKSNKVKRGAIKRDQVTANLASEIDKVNRKR